MTRNIIIAVSLALLIPAAARADTAKFDKAMEPVLAQYLKIHKALAGDTDKGVARAAAKIVKLTARLKPGTVSGKHAAHYKKLPAKIKAAAAKLAKAKGLAAQRKALKPLSQPLAMWATMSKVITINVVFCSMARGSWLQQQKVIANPYYGSKMLRCGEIISGKDKGTRGGHMKGHKH